jgi:uncharacterized protein
MKEEEQELVNQDNPYFEEWGQKPYNAFPVWFKKKYGQRYQKISLDAGFTCPNRDGTKGLGGCTYCNNKSFTPSYCSTEDILRTQVEEGIKFFSVRYRRASKFLGYLQSYSNTYKPFDELKELYEFILKLPNIYGLVIATRPDCVDEKLLDYLELLAKDHMIFLEYGIESCYDDTLVKINRGHSFLESKTAIAMSAGRSIHLTAHLLFGLPGESKQMMLAQAEMMSELPIDSLKFHQLQIIKGTKMASEYVASPESFNLFSLEEYMDFAIDFLERLSPSISVQRFFNETPPKFKLAPDWGLMRSDVLNKMLEQIMIDQGRWQGRSFGNFIGL